MEAVDLAVVLVHVVRVRDGEDGGEVQEGDAGGVNLAASLDGLDGQVCAGILRLGQTQLIDADANDKLLPGYPKALIVKATNKTYPTPHYLSN
jgi:hypothetical protein